MLFTDTHTHLYLDEFKDDIDCVIANSIKAGVENLIIPNVDSTSLKPLHELCNRFPKNCFPMVGLHPTHVKDNFKDELAVVEQELKNYNFVGIGEIGIDLYWDKSFAKQQEEAFRKQIEWAIKYNLPIAVHSRKSLDTVINILKEYDTQGIKGVLHCFPGNILQAEKAIELGFYIGIGGVVTYNKSDMANVALNIPLEYILLETDAPFLTPSPYRGKRNESAYILNIAEKISELKSLPLEIVAEITTKNALILFNKIH